MEMSEVVKEYLQKVREYQAIVDQKDSLWDAITELEQVMSAYLNRKSINQFALYIDDTPFLVLHDFDGTIGVTELEMLNDA